MSNKLTFKNLNQLSTSDLANLRKFIKNNVILNGLYKGRINGKNKFLNYVKDKNV